MKFGVFFIKMIKIPTKNEIRKQYFVWFNSLYLFEKKLNSFTLGAAAAIWTLANK